MTSIAVAALLAGMQLVIGEPMALVQVWLLIGTAALVFARRRAHLLIPIVVLAVLVAAVQLLPAVDHARDSARSRGIAYDVARQFSMPAVRPLEIAVPHLFGVFDPFAAGYWGAKAFDRNAPYLYSIYNGIGVAILALAGFLLRARGSRTVAVLGLISYVLAIGDRTPLLHFLYATGIARGIRYPEKFAALGVVAITIFAATIADRLLSGDVVARRAALIAAAIVTTVSAALVVWSLTPSSFFSHWQSLAAFYQGRRDRFRAGLASTALKLLPCEGTYFQCVDYSALSNLPDRAFCEWLATERGVAAIPMSAFYETAPDMRVIRFCFAKKEATLDAALQRLQALRA